MGSRFLLRKEGEVELFFGDAGGDQFYSDGVSHLVWVFCTAAYKAGEPLVILKVSITKYAYRDHTVRVGQLLFNIKSAVRNARDNSIKFFTKMSSHILYLLHLDRVALGFCRAYFAL